MALMNFIAPYPASLRVERVGVRRPPMGDRISSREAPIFPAIVDFRRLEILKVLVAHLCCNARSLTNEVFRS